MRRLSAIALVALAALGATSLDAVAAKPAPRQGSYGCYVLDTVYFPDGTFGYGPYPSALGTLRLGRTTYRSNVGRGKWHYDRRRGKPVFTTGPLRRLFVTWDPRRGGLMTFTYRSQNHYCNR
jgi:hypothetical protein